MQTQNLMSNVLIESSDPEPRVGMGATICLYTDRYPGTIVKVTATQVQVQEDDAKRVDNNGMSDSQVYEYSRNPRAIVHVFRKTKRGYRSSRGYYLHIGTRRKFHDFSF